MRRRALRTEADFEAQHNEEVLKLLKEATVQLRDLLASSPRGHDLWSG